VRARPAWRKCLAPCYCEEAAVGETRVALLPDAVKKLIASGLEVVVEVGAGVKAGILDEAYTQAGATLTTDRAALLASADILPWSTRPRPRTSAGSSPAAL